MLVLALVLCVGAASAMPLANQSYPLVTAPGAKPFNGKEPLQQRVAYDTPYSMAVSWNTYAQLNDSEAVVWYGQDPLYLTEKASAVSTTFNTSRTWSHHAILTGLKPKTVYHYRVFNTNCLGCNTIPSYTFTTPRVPGDEEPYTVAVVADMGLMGPDGLSNVVSGSSGGALGNNEVNTIQSMTQNLDAFDHIVHVGDLAYADYFLKESVDGYFGNSSVLVNATSIVENYEKLNEEFYDQILPLTAQRSYMVAIGNHESNCDNGGVTDKVNNITYTAKICMPGQTNFTAYAEHWNMPSNGGSPRSKNFWYSYDNGMTHYIVYDTETDFGAGLYAPDEVGGTGKQMSGPRGKVNEQIDWLKADLAAVNRTKTPWVVAFGHRPFYNGIGNALCAPCAKAFEKIFVDGGVDLVMNGHNHVYSRTVPVWNNTADPNGYNNPKWPMYITNGLGGHYDGMDTNDSPLPKNIAAGIDHVYGWSLVTFQNRTHMKHEFVASKNSTILDTVWLYKQH